jgi:hypothetical protein
VVPSSSRAAIETLRRRQNLASTSGKLGAGHIEFAADKLVMRDRRTLPSRQRTYRYLHVRVDRLEHAISHFYNAIKPVSLQHHSKNSKANALLTTQSRYHKAIMALAAQRTGADVASNAIQGDGSRSPMKIFYCFHQIMNLLSVK